MQDFREIVWSGIELLNITAQALRNGLVQRVGHEPPALIDHVHGDIARSRQRKQLLIWIKCHTTVHQ
jgi:hypothetical protein